MLFVNIFFALCYTLTSINGQSEITPYRFPMLIGRGFNMETGKVGKDLFSQEEVAKATTHINTLTDVSYKLVSNNREVNDYLQVNGELSLQVKAGNFKIEGSGGYLKDSQDRTKTVEILVVHRFNTVKKTLRSESVALLDCSKLGPDDRGTHYIRSVQYGGMLIASLKFISTTKSDKEDIEAAVKGSIGMEGKFGLDVSGKFKKLAEKTNGEYRMEYFLSGTYHLDKIPGNVTEFLAAIEEFPKKAREHGLADQIGVPIEVELYTIDSLENCKPNPPLNWKRNNQLNGDISDIEGKFDDIRVARAAFTMWKDRVDLNNIKQSALIKFGNFNKKLRDVDRVLRNTIGKLDISVKADSTQFDSAIEAYEGDESNDYGNLKFRLELGKMQEDVRQTGCEKLKCPPNGQLNNGYCYMIKADHDYTWAEARQTCYTLYGDAAELASVATLEEEAWLVSTSSRQSSRSHNSFWLGARRRERTFNEWIWVDEKTPWSVNQWSVGEPNNVGGNERCLEMRSFFQQELNGRTWNDLNCDAKRGYICKLKPACAL